MKTMGKIYCIVLLVTSISLLALNSCTGPRETTSSVTTQGYPVTTLASTTSTSASPTSISKTITTAYATQTTIPAITSTTSNFNTTSTPIPTGEIFLPMPAIAQESVEYCLNSRESIGTITGTLTTQQLSNVLWAAGKAPLTGPSRKIIVATQAGQFGPGTGGTYLYDPDSHSLFKVSDTLTDQGAFKISWDVGQNGSTFDAGLIYMPSLLAAVSSWDSSSPISEGPKGVDIVFGAQSALPSKSQCVAISSLPQTDPGFLPNPSTTGTDNLADVLANLKYTNKFNQTHLTLQQISQILWAGYGCTPHKDTHGITTPSAYDSLYLTGTIYLVNENGVFRYQNRQPTDNFFTHPNDPSNFFNTRDHRLEQMGSKDVRDSLRSAVSGLPLAPCYIVLSLDRKYNDDATTIKTYANLETGFVASNYLLQASAMGLGCNFKTQLTSGEQSSIQSVTGIPVVDQPLVVVSIGNVGN